MDPNKTTILRFKPISEITEEEMNEEVVTTDGKGHWCQGLIFNDEKHGVGCLGQKDDEGLFDLTLYAVLPKD